MTMSQTLSSDAETAYHEAGHAVIAGVFGRPPIAVSIVPDTKNPELRGITRFADDCPQELKNHFYDSPQKRDYVAKRILTELAATIAHDLKMPGRKHDRRDANDSYWAMRVIEDHAGWIAAEERQKALASFRNEARQLLELNWPWVEAVAAALIQQKELSGDDVMALRPE
jgi:hypothetical protein